MDNDQNNEKTSVMGIMERVFPELEIKITPEQIEAADKQSKSINLRPMVAWFHLTGTFGKDRNQHEIARRLYEVTVIPAVGNQPEEIDDETAYNRFDNVISGRRKMLDEEVDFFRKCIAFHLGENLAASISCDEIREGKALGLMRKLFLQAPALSWIDIDPLTAILSLACSRLEIDVSFSEKKLRRAGDKDSLPILQRLETDVVYQPGRKFFIDSYVPKNFLKTKPLVLEFGYDSVRTKDGRILRATNYPITKKFLLSETIDKGEVPEPDCWRTFMRPKTPFNVTEEKGRFGFLVLGKAGGDIAHWIPENADPECLNNEDLKYMYEKLIHCASMEDDIIYGMESYRVD